MKLKMHKFVLPHLPSGMRSIYSFLYLIYTMLGGSPEVGDGQGGLACCDSWGRKESDTTERLN